MDNQLYDRRKELGLTLEEVGNLCGVGKSTVRKWENGLINNMGRDKIVSLAKALKVSPLYILQTECSERILSKYDMQLLNLCDLLNDLGKEEAGKRVEELTCIDKYVTSIKKESLMPILKAAHNDHADLQEQQELMEEDLKDMEDNW